MEEMEKNKLLDDDLENVSGGRSDHADDYIIVVGDCMKNIYSIDPNERGIPLNCCGNYVRKMPSEKYTCPVCGKKYEFSVR